MAEINADPKVMEFFPCIQTLDQTRDFVNRMQKQFAEKGFCYFAVDRLDNGEFIGFIGLSEQHFQSDFTPCIDIGWRLKSSAWYNGFATEEAKRCLEFGFKELGLPKIVAMAPKINLPSINVMTKIGMHWVRDFNHLKLKGDKRLERCVLYELNL